MQYRNSFTLVFRFTLFNNAGVLILEQFVVYLPISDEKLISMNLLFATVDRNVTGAPGCPLAVTWISMREPMTSGQPRERNGDYADI